MTWLREYGPALLIAALIIGTVSGWLTGARWKGVAEGHAAEAQRLTEDVRAQADSTEAARARAEAARRDAQAANARADEAEAETRSVRAQSAQRIAALQERLAALSSMDAELEEAIEAEAERNDGWIRLESHRRHVANLRRQNAAIDSLMRVERAAKLQERARGDAQKARADALQVQVSEMESHIASQDVQIGVMERRDSVRVATIEALERAADSGGLLPDLGALTDPLLIAGGAVLGYTIAEVR